MKLSAKISLTMASMIAIILILGSTSVFQIEKMNGIVFNATDVYLPAVRYIEEINTCLVSYRVQELRHVYSDDPAYMSICSQEMANLTNQVMTRLQNFEALPHDAKEKTVLANYKARRADFFRAHQKMIPLSEQGKSEEAIALITGESRIAFDAMNAAIQEMVQIQLDKSRQGKKEGDDTYSSARMLTLVLLVGAILIAVVLTIYIVRGILAQLGKDPGDLMQIARRVSKGDYNIDDGSPKIGVFGHVIEMVTSLKEHIDKANEESARAAQESKNAREAMKKTETAMQEAQRKTDAMIAAANKLEEVAGIVSSASAELAAQIEQSEHGASEQASRIAETATAMEEMNSTVLEVARNAASASDISATTRTQADDGFKIVRQSVDAIHHVQQQSEALKADMGKLSENAQAISQIMGVISDIADQTNLLALNAAIEAARAGEAGRGFAVVADEVRKLAEKTMASTSDVGSAIKAIQESASKSMEQMDAATKSVEEATNFANQSGEALSKIVGMVDNTADQVRAIATASEQQSASSEEINQSITQVNTIAGETAQAMQEAAKAVSDLTNQAQVLTKLIEDMKSH